ncbi:hypothetical protein [Sphingosinicella sp. BN140058]|uniref:hypothetical protein n=1 Tax=Sphingosinicella sp. BN140058 TaxID=1892855 RepID=UPI001010C402|nr:hypothetical protein [Sphingosinicella sp. BN140058]QAY78147.1 hypothetical protein ETR14_17655 [Sphingosinicella sp. BN140058]
MSANEELAASLEKLGIGIMANIGDDRPFNTLWGWNLPPLTRQEFASIPNRLAVQLRGIPASALSPNLVASLKAAQERVEFLLGNSIPNLTSQSNIIHIYPQVEQLVDLIQRALPVPPPPKTAIDWKEVAAKQQLPPELLRRLRSVEASLKAIEPRSAKVTEQVEAIEAAHSAAESLPTDLASLEEARATIDAATNSSTAAASAAEQALVDIDAARIRIEEKEKEAMQLVANCGEAYRVTTTKGLAASFDSRAQSLNWSLVAWVIGLLAALAGGSYVASQRLELIQELMRSDGSVQQIWVHVALALLSVGAPVWFAWIATKQIGQRFRLAEDYAFKASVAKAYEGYRREAARIDPAFEARLFGSALTRLEEAPLRLVEQEAYGSPWHELTSSPAFEKALALIPELKERYLTLLSKSEVGATSVGGKHIKPAVEPAE